MMRLLFAALLLPLTACDLLGGGEDETLTATELGDVDTLDGTITDDMIDVDTAATPEGEVEAPKPVVAEKAEEPKVDAAEEAALEPAAEDSAE